MPVVHVPYVVTEPNESLPAHITEEYSNSKESWDAIYNYLKPLTL